MDPPVGHSDLLREFLTDRDVPCPNCRYNLRGLRESSCPECGDPLALALSRRAPKHMTRFAVGFAPLCAGLNFAFLAAAEIIYGGEESLHADWKHVLVYAVATGVYGAGALALWHAHRRIRKMTLPQLRELCFCTWGAALGVAAVAVWAVRSV